MKYKIIDGIAFAIFIASILFVGVVIVEDAHYTIEKSHNYNKIENSISAHKQIIIYNTDECRGSKTELFNKALKEGYTILSLDETDKNFNAYISTGNNGGFVVPVTKHVTTYIFKKVSAK